MNTGTTNSFWFLNTHISIRISGHDNADHISVLEHQAYYADSPPLHIHHTEDEVFVLLEGAFRFVIGDNEYRLKAGETILAPKGIPHTYIVESQSGGKWLTITSNYDFEDFIRTFSTPTEVDTLPEQKGPPSEELKTELTATLAQYNIEIAGPPLHP